MSSGKTSILLTLAASVLISLSAEAQVVDYGEDNGILSFEESTSPALAGKGSSLSVSTEHAKLGQTSLEWNWKHSGAFISIKGDIPYMPENPDPKETSVSTFVFWVYSPEKIEGGLRFTFLKEGRECCSFTYHMGFQGWRGSWVAFDRDMTGTPETGMDEIRISAPEGSRKGRLFLDGIIPSSFQDIRHHTPDWQAPFVNEKTTNHWLVLNNSWKKKLDITPKQSLSESDRKDLETIRNRFISLVTENVKPLSIKKAREIYDSYAISYNPDGTITGKPIFFIRYGETFLNLGIPDAKKAFRQNGQLLRTLNDNMLRIAVSAMKAEDKEQKEDFTRMYIELTRHILDQGFAAGSGQGTLHHLGYSMRNFYTAPVIMQEELRQAGLAEEMQKAMEWFSGVGEVKTAPTEAGMDIDAFNTSLMGRMASVIMLENTSHKLAFMQAVSRWIDNGMKHTEGLKACFKRDGSVVHHRKSYPAYATGGFSGAVDAVWMLSGTGLAISQESHQNLKDALLAMKFYCYGDMFPLAMSGRHPDGKGSLIRGHYTRLADAGSPDGRHDTDTDLLQMAPLHGTRYFPFNCSLSHRHGGVLVTIAGHSRYIWSAEIYNQANHYGRYLTHGSIQLNGPDSDDRLSGGFSQEGWDWCHIPGTTAAVLPMEKMKANVLNVDEYSGYEEMLLSDEWFAGAVTHKGTSGAFAMKLHEHDKYNGTLRAHKSFFVIEDRVYCLGSDIANALAGAPVHTTLFQGVFKEGSSNWINSTGDILQDSGYNTYFLKGCKAQMHTGLQHSLHEESDKPTSGIFEKAYIDHGDIIDGGRYEYMILLPGTKTIVDTLELMVYSKALPYEVLRHDAQTHGVRDIPTGICAFAVFEEGRVDSLVTRCSPAMLMYSSDEETLTLSVSNPDLALYEGESDEEFDENGKRIERSIYSRKWINNPCGETEIRVTLEGVWEIEDKNGCNVTAAIDNGQTILTFRSKEARTEEITLEKSKQNDI